MSQLEKGPIWIETLKKELKQYFDFSKRLLAKHHSLKEIFTDIIPCVEARKAVNVFIKDFFFIENDAHKH